MKFRRKILMLICLIPGLSFLQSCSLADQLLFTWAFLTQERWRDGENYLVFDTYFHDHIALGPGYLVIRGALPVGPFTPSFLRWTQRVFPSGGSSWEQIFVTPVMEDGAFEGHFRICDSVSATETSHGEAVTDEHCPVLEFDGSTGMSVSVSPRGGFVALGTNVSGEIAMRPIEKLKRCTPKVLSTSGVPSTAKWIRRPGKSTKQIIATGSQIGVKVHCVKTKTGAQGTLKVTNTNGKKDFILFQCD